MRAELKILFYFPNILLIRLLKSSYFRAIGWKEVDRMERIIRDKLRQRSFATSSPFQVRKSFKFFDTEKCGTLDTIGITRAFVFLGFEFSYKQILALFARYDTNLSGTVDYMKVYKTCMDKDDDAPPIIPDVSHLGEDVDLGSRPSTSLAESSTKSDTGYTDEELTHLQRAEINRIFSMLDKVGSNSIHGDELELLLLALNVNLTPNELSSVKAIICNQEDQRIYFDSFFSWWSVRSHK